MENELIEAVRKVPYLYNIKHEDYTNFELKNSAWERIAQILRCKNGKEVKRAWETLRNNHRDALRRQKNPNSRPSVKTERFLNQMSFLIPYMAIRLSHAEEVQNDEQHQSNLLSHSNRVEEVQNEPHQIFPENDDHMRKESRIKKRNNLNKSIEKLKKRASDRQRERRPRLLSTNGESEPLFHFFMSMYETTKILSPLSQHAIKKSIFTLITKEESKHLIHGPQSGTTCFSDVITSYSSCTPSPKKENRNVSDDSDSDSTSSPCKNNCTMKTKS